MRTMFMLRFTFYFLLSTFCFLLSTFYLLLRHPLWSLERREVAQHVEVELHLALVGTVGLHVFPAPHDLIVAKRVTRDHGLHVAFVERLQDDNHLCAAPFEIGRRHSRQRTLGVDRMHQR